MPPALGMPKEKAPLPSTLMSKSVEKTAKKGMFGVRQSLGLFKDKEPVKSIGHFEKKLDEIKPKMFEERPVDIEKKLASIMPKQGSKPVPKPFGKEPLPKPALKPVAKPAPKPAKKGFFKSIFGKKTPKPVAKPVLKPAMPAEKKPAFGEMPKPAFGGLPKSAFGETPKPVGSKPKPIGKKATLEESVFGVKSSHASIPKPAAKPVFPPKPLAEKKSLSSMSDLSGEKFVPFSGSGISLSHPAWPTSAQKPEGSILSQEKKPFTLTITAMPNNNQTIAQFMTNEIKNIESKLGSKVLDKKETVGHTFISFTSAKGVEEMLNKAMFILHGPKVFKIMFSAPRDRFKEVNDSFWKTVKSVEFV